MVNGLFTLVYLGAPMNLRRHPPIHVIAFLLSTAFLSACQNSNHSKPNTHADTPLPLADHIAPGAPGATPTWAYAGKTGIGTAYEHYHNGKFAKNPMTGKVSKVWFSLAQGIVTETMYGLIHEAQLKDMQLYIKGEGFFDEEKTDTISETRYLHTDSEGAPLSLAYKIINRDKENKYIIEKHIFTDPDENTLFMRLRFTALEAGITPYLYVNPHVANTGTGDNAWQEDNTLYAQDGDTTLALLTSQPFTQSSVGFVASSDNLAAIERLGKMTHTYTSTGTTKGNVAFTAALPLDTTKANAPLEIDIAIGFGDSAHSSRQAAANSLNTGYRNVLAHYNGEGSSIGWEDYIFSLPHHDKLAEQSTDRGKLLNASAMVIKAQEDKTYAGALIASLSNPWGDTRIADVPQTGYKAVWPRDFYQVAMALLALGDTESAKIAFDYLQKVQVTRDMQPQGSTPGWFLQKTHVDGTLEWVSVQLDQTAMPIMLGWQLWKAGVLTDSDIAQYYPTMLKPAADFLANGGKVNVMWNQTTIQPPFTQQERWEEQAGYSPSTTAAIITGLISAADIATLLGDLVSAQNYANAADNYARNLEKYTFTTKGSIATAPANGNYYLRISQNKNPNDHAPLNQSNGKEMPNESDILDAGFLELVRYGIKAPNDTYIQESLPEIDDTNLKPSLRLKYLFPAKNKNTRYPGWRRYGDDGYGEDTVTGLAYTANGENSPNQRGRVWPFFTGERGHFELAQKLHNGSISANELQTLRSTYVSALEHFANSGLMLPEQVWDGVGSNNTYHYTLGEGTNSATPLAWTHAEYIKLLRSLADKKIWDKNSSAEQRYQKETPTRKNMQRVM